MTQASLCRSGSACVKLAPPPPAGGQGAPHPVRLRAGAWVSLTYAGLTALDALATLKLTADGGSFFEIASGQLGAV